MALSQLKAAGWSPWRDAVWWLAYSLIGGLLPIWVGVLVFTLFGLDVDVTTFASHGEFFIYSAAFATPVFHHLHRDWRGKQFLFGRWFQVFAVASVLISAVVYSGVLASDAPGDVPGQIDMQFVHTIGYVLLPFTILLGFLVTAIEQIMTASIDGREIGRARQQKLGQAFDDLN